MSVYSQSPIEKLSATNYAEWCSDIRHILIDRQAWRIVTGEELKPDLKKDGVTAEDLRSFELRRDSALTLIFLNVSTEFKRIIENCTDPSDSWKTLKKYFEPDNRSRYVQLYTELHECKIKPGGTICMYASRIKQIHSQLVNINKPLNEEILTLQLLRYLPSKFDPTVQAILRWENEKFKFNDVQLELTADTWVCLKNKRESRPHPGNSKSDRNQKSSDR